MFARSEVHDCVYRCQKHTSERVGDEPWSGSQCESECAIARARHPSGAFGRARRRPPPPANRAEPAAGEYLGQSRELCVSKQNIFFYASIVVEHWDTQRFCFLTL